ncbi:hypothetical protein AVEN_234668-1 [Araneus ventricosus]|uniref:Uncharacterized protein n=1 Tax=Araneus ventricosus TaxID=182803 RepID=A0A4Y2D0D9_ARAVE|nr:hypothetical protein AVEN_234668-1 [Araneus ventricosus]
MSYEAIQGNKLDVEVSECDVLTKIWYQEGRVNWRLIVMSLEEADVRCLNSSVYRRPNVTSELREHVFLPKSSLTGGNVCPDDTSIVEDVPILTSRIPEITQAWKSQTEDEIKIIIIRGCYQRRVWRKHKHWVGTTFQWPSGKISYDAMRKPGCLLISSSTLLLGNWEKTRGTRIAALMDSGHQALIDTYRFNKWPDPSRYSRVFSFRIKQSLFGTCCC